MNCSCCGNQRISVELTQSPLVNNNIPMCAECRNNDHQPRYLVKLVHQSNIDVSNYIEDERYCGKALSLH